MKTDLKAKAKSWFTKDKILLYIISFVVAVALWAAVIIYANPDTTIVIQKVPVRINTSSQDAVSLSIVSGKIETVDVEVKAPRSQVPSLNTESVTAEIDLTGETKSGTYEKAIEVSSNSEFVKIISVSPATTTIVLDVTESKTLLIEVDDGGYAAPEGYYIASPSLSTDSVKITGPKAVIDGVSRAVVDVQIEEDSVGIIDFRDCPIRFVDANGEDVDFASATADVDKVTVSVPIIRRKVVELKLDFTNTPMLTDDYYKLTYSIGDETYSELEDIEIAAVDDVYEEISSITIGTLDFSRIYSRSYTTEFTLDMPTGVTNISGITTVGVTIEFTGMTTDSITILPEDIILKNVPSGKTAAITSKSLRVTICGSSASVKLAKSNGVEAAVTLSATSAGVREYPVSINFGELQNVWVYVSDGASAPAVNVEIK
ncbi:MAG: hypothetical protein IJL83_00620 [Clostridia bacterium]|nr:hypothetical protein [Clostridia bacterium]